MGNWYGTARTNYVRVTDIDALKEVLPDSIEVVEQYDQKKGGTFYAFLSQDGDSGGFPSGREDSNGDWEDFDFGEFLMDYIPNGEVLILMCAGAEKMCYITGISTAFTWGKTKGGKKVLRCKRISIEDIYGQVRKHWKIDPTQASY